jgi:hypothetical protein
MMNKWKAAFGAFLQRLFIALNLLTWQIINPFIRAKTGF